MNHKLIITLKNLVVCFKNTKTILFIFYSLSVTSFIVIRVHTYILYNSTK